MHKIVDFKYIHSADINNDSTIFERTPIAISWNYRDENFIVKNEYYRIHADISKDKKYIAIVEGPYAVENNLSYIINCSKEIVYDVKKILLQKNNISPHKMLFFEGVCSKNNVFEFKINLDGYDFRFSFDVVTAEIGEIVESR